MMYTILGKTERMRRPTQAGPQKNEQLARMLVDALGYEGALEEARNSHWDKVAESIRFLAGQSLRRF